MDGVCEKMKERTRSLTLCYSVTQFTYWAASTGAASFATIYLLDRGMPSGVIGTLLAISGIVSCICQPFLAAGADRSKEFVLKKMLLLACSWRNLCQIWCTLDDIISSVISSAEYDLHRRFSKDCKEGR